MKADEAECALVEQARGGNAAAFRGLVMLHQRRIFALTLRMTGSRQTAEDLAQETFLRAFAQLASYCGEASLYTWLYRIAINLCLRHLEREKRLTFAAWPPVPTADEVPEPSDRLSPEQLVLREEVKVGCLTGLVRCLPSQQRATFVLAVLLEVPDRDVASILGCSAGAVKARLSRARRSLADFLERRCQWIDADNRCRCQRYIQHSLDRGLITSNPDERVAAQDVAPLTRELGLLRRVVRVYGSLAPPPSPKNLVDRICEGIAKGEWRLLK